MNHTEVLLSIQKHQKIYDALIYPIKLRYSITDTEVDIIGFLYTNPGIDTSQKIVELRRFSKSNVSVSLERLVKKGLIKTQRDTDDRRLVHLSLTESAVPIAKDFVSAIAEYENMLFDGFTSQERAQFNAFSDRIVANVKKALK